MGLDYLFLLYSIDLSIFKFFYIATMECIKIQKIYLNDITESDLRRCIALLRKGALQMNRLNVVDSINMHADICIYIHQQALNHTLNKYHHKRNME